MGRKVSRVFCRDVGRDVVGRDISPASRDVSIV
jgi:hypothetical protein